MARAGAWGTGAVRARAGVRAAVRARARVMGAAHAMAADLAGVWDLAEAASPIAPMPADGTLKGHGTQR